MPPPVEPAQAPQNMSRISTSWEKWGQNSQSVVAKPVVEMMEATWKKAYRKAWGRLGYSPRMFHAIRRVAPATTSRKKRSSSLFRASLHRRVSTRKYRAKFTENSSTKTEMIRSTATLP